MKFVMAAVGLWLVVCLFASALATSIQRTITTTGSIATVSPDMPVHVHLTWQSQDMATTITVTWQSAKASSGNTIKYDVVSHEEASALYAYSKNGVAPHPPYSGSTVFIHDVELTGLIPDEIYYFIVGGDLGGWSAERKFRTASATPLDVNFVAGSDSRTNAVERDKISAAMAAFNPSFVLLGGDLVETGTTQSQWDDFFTKMDSLWVDSNGFTIPVIPALGNHEGNAENYYQQFALPNNEQWYSLNWGNLLHIIVLNSETALTGSQLAWLQTDLAANANYPWKIALFHWGPYDSCASHGSNTGARSSWTPLFDQYHVQVVITGHNHDYERSKPVYNQALASSYASGTMYVVAGSWGAPLYPAGANWWTAYSSSLYHFTVMTAYATGTFDYSAKNDSGVTFDSVQITSP